MMYKYKITKLKTILSDFCTSFKSSEKNVNCYLSFSRILTTRILDSLR